MIPGYGRKLLGPIGIGGDGRRMSTTDLENENAYLKRLLEQCTGATDGNGCVVNYNTLLQWFQEQLENMQKGVYNRGFTRSGASRQHHDTVGQGIPDGPLLLGGVCHALLQLLALNKAIHVTAVH